MTIFYDFIVKLKIYRNLPYQNMSRVLEGLSINIIYIKKKKNSN